MTFTRCITLVALATMSGLAPAGLVNAEEDDFYHYNSDAMARHDAAMYQLVDDLSDCAGYHSMLTNGSSHTSAMVQKNDKHRAAFLALGADALATLVPGPRSSQVLEMEARIISSHRSLQNTFGSLGGAADAELKAMEQTCERLRTSKRRVFGWTRIRNDK